jgi:anti-anti-sigma regulatory factor
MPRPPIPLGQPYPTSYMFWEGGSRSFSMVISNDGDTAFVDIGGQLDSNAATRVKGKLDWVRDAYHSIVLDLSSVTFVDLSGFDPILGAVQVDRNVIVGATSRAIRSLLELIDPGWFLG